MSSTSLARRISWKQAGLLFLIALALWLPRGFGLDRFVATDEVAWLWRSANFYYALGQRDPTAVKVNRSPGLVTMWVNTAAFLIEFPEYRGFGQGVLNKYALLEEFLERHAVDPHDILVTGRRLMALLNTAVLALAFVFARRLVGSGPALVGFLLLAFDPYHIGLTRLAHLDGPLSSFACLALLAGLAYLFAGRQPLALGVSAGAAALAVLAKIPGLLLLPTLGLLWLAAAWSERRSAPATPRRTAWVRRLRPALIWSAVFGLTLWACFPAMWVQPVQTALRLVESPLRFAGTSGPAKPGLARPEPAVDATGIGADDQTGDIEVASRSRPLAYFLRYPEKYLWHSTPIALLGLGAALAAFVRRKSPFDGRTGRQAALGLALFVLLYTVAMTIPAKSSSKYYLPVYPALDLLAGMGWYALAAAVAGRLPAGSVRRWAPAGVLGFAILLQLTQALPVYPYYLTYLNPLVMSSPAARAGISMGSGEGLDQAAAYLNQKPDPQDLDVMAWYGVGPFSYFFAGRTTPLTPGARAWDAQSIATLEQMDYLVVYSSQWTRQLPGGLFPFLEGTPIEQQIFLNGIEYARIYAVADIPSEKFLAQP